MSQQAADRSKCSERKPRAGLLTLLFKYLAGTGKIKQTLGDREGVGLVQRHDAVVRDLLHGFSDAQEVDAARDSFFIAFAKPSDAVRFALMLHFLRADSFEEFAAVEKSAAAPGK